MKKRIMAGLLCLLLLIVLVGCGEETPESVVNNFLSNYQLKDFETSLAYLEGNSFKISSLNNEDKQALQLFQEIGSKMEYKNVELKSSTEDTAVVTAEITNIDTALIFSDIMKDLLVSSLATAFLDDSNENLNNDTLFYDKFLDALKNPDLTTKEFKVSINLKKIDGQWKIISDDEFVNAITGNLAKVVKDFSNI